LPTQPPEPAGRAALPYPIQDSHEALGQLYRTDNQTYKVLHHLCFGRSCLSEDTKAAIKVRSNVGQIEDVLDVGPSNFAHLNGYLCLNPQAEVHPNDLQGFVQKLGPRVHWVDAYKRVQRLALHQWIYTMSQIDD
jgi:hypothetical protein